MLRQLALCNWSWRSFSRRLPDLPKYFSRKIVFSIRPISFNALATEFWREYDPSRLITISLFECIDLPVQVLVSGRAAGISDDHGNFVYLVSVSGFKIDFVSHITRYTKLRIRTDVVKNFLKKYVIRWFCIQAICTTVHSVYRIFAISQYKFKLIYCICKYIIYYLQ